MVWEAIVPSFGGRTSVPVFPLAAKRRQKDLTSNTFLCLTFLCLTSFCLSFFVRATGNRSRIIPSLHGATSSSRQDRYIFAGRLRSLGSTRLYSARDNVRRDMHSSLPVFRAGLARSLHLAAGNERPHFPPTPQRPPEAGYTAAWGGAQRNPRNIKCHQPHAP